VTPLLLNSNANPFSANTQKKKKKKKMGTTLLRTSETIVDPRHQQPKPPNYRIKELVRPSLADPPRQSKASKGTKAKLGLHPKP
jgi:hypothetical protein